MKRSKWEILKEGNIFILFCCILYIQRRGDEDKWIYTILKKD